MAQLYAEIQSDKGARTVGRGADASMIIVLKNGNNIIGTIEYYTTDNKKCQVYYNGRLIDTA